MMSRAKGRYARIIERIQWGIITLMVLASLFFAGWLLVWAIS